jgi:hypothetical protein
MNEVFLRVLAVPGKVFLIGYRTKVVYILRENGRKIRAWLISYG